MVEIDRIVASAALALTFGVGFSSLAMAQSSAGVVAPRINEAPDKTLKPRIYIHPKKGFSVAIPANAEIVKRGKDKQLTMRSRTGYALNIQSGPVQHQIPLNRMPEVLEAKYLGQGKPWSHKIRDSHMKVGGLPSFSVDYAGSSSKTRVVVSRGTTNDFVFIFVAPDTEFAKLEKELSWILEQFRPSADDLHAALESPPNKRPRTRRFAEPGFGYSMEYPDAWEVSNPAEMSAMFSGKVGSSDYAAIVGIQNIEPLGAIDGFDAANRALGQLKGALSDAVRKLKFEEESAWAYSRDGMALQGRQVLATYDHGGRKFRKLMIVVPRPSGAIAHIWSFTAPDTVFAEFKPLAELMLESWTIQSNALN